jgi:hypothetical protein
MAGWLVWPALAPIAIFVSPVIATPTLVVPLILASVLAGAHGLRLWHRAGEPAELPIARAIHRR